MGEQASLIIMTTPSEVEQIIKFFCLFGKSDRKGWINMLCKNCKNNITNPLAQFCGKCGAQIGDNASAKQTATMQRTTQRKAASHKLKHRVILPATALLVIVIGAVLINALSAHSAVGRWELVENRSHVLFGGEFEFRPYSGLFDRGRGAGLVTNSGGWMVHEWRWSAWDGSMTFRAGPQLGQRWLDYARMRYSIRGSYLFLDIETARADGSEVQGGSLVLRRMD